MTYLPTPEEFLAQTEPDDGGEEFTVELRAGVAADPLVSIAESLRYFVDLQKQHEAADAAEKRLEAELLELEEAYRALDAKLDDIKAIIKPSTSKLANAIRAALEPAPVEVAEEPEGDVVYVCPHCETGWGERVDPCLECGQPSSEATERPANDAPVEEWRAYARGRGYQGPDVDKANRSQIRTMLGIPHGGEAADQ